MGSFTDYFWAFVVGGSLCAVAQVLIDFTKLTPARIMVAYVVAGVVLSGAGLYEPLIEFAGGGATIPLLGFGNVIAQGTLEAVRKDGLIGALTGGLSASSGGVTAAIFFGFLAAIIFKPKDIS